LYIAAQEQTIGAVLTQEDKGKEFTVAYLSRRLVDAETRYKFIEKLCLSLYFACNKLRRYLLSSVCTIVCQHDVVKFILQKPVLRGRIRKWIYSLVEYDLHYESLQSVKGQVVADFVVDHMVSVDGGIGLVESGAWSLFFDGVVCRRGQGVGYIIVSPNGKSFEASVQLDFECTKNEVEYEALLYGLEHLISMGVRDVDVYGDSKLMVQQGREPVSR
jgi:hypothetical protein